MVRRPNIYEVVFASVDTRAVLPQLIGSDVVKSGWESRDVMTDWRRHTCGSLCCLYVISHLPSEVAREVARGFGGQQGSSVIEPAGRLIQRFEPGN